MRNRQDEIRAKGFDIFRGARRDYDGPLDYNSIKVGTKKLNDATLDLNSIRKVHPYFGDKRVVLQAIMEGDLPLMREISNFFYKTSGIYSRVCDYYAYLYRYDWYVVPEIFDTEVPEKKILTDFSKILNYLDNSHIKQRLGEIALEVIKNGAYYGYLIPSNDGIVIQQLPINYCRSIYNINGKPVVEFNMKFFDENFHDPNYRVKILKLFPKEFQKGYLAYKTGKLEPDYEHAQPDYTPYGRASAYGWYVLDPSSTIKFSTSNNDQPMFINAIPAILDLDMAQGLDRQKQMQQLLKIVIQKLPLDKNGDLIFDVDEARDIHNNAVEMLEHAVGVDVLTTFADIDVEDMADTNTTTKTDDLEHMERAVYNAFGTSRNLFNTDGNLSLEKSILDDESSMRGLLLQFSSFLDSVTQKLGKNKKKYNYRLYMLETTQYNYQALAKMYKEQVQLGYSKMLPQIAMGHSQSSIIHTAYFENKVLNLSEIMIPPLMSSTMNADLILGKDGQTNTSKTQKTTEGQSTTSSSGEAGRPAKPNDEKSEKTLANEESMS